MNSRFLRMAAAGLLAAVLLSQPLHSQSKKRLSFEQIFNNAEPRIVADLPTVVGWVDDSHYLVSKRRPGEMFGGSRYSVSVATGKEVPYLDMQPYKSLVEAGIVIDFPLSSSSSNTRFIYQKERDLFLLDTQQKSCKRLTQTPEEEKNPTLSPDGSYVAYTREGNLYVTDINTGKEQALTSDGSKFIYNGWASWIYYEEILGRRSAYKAFWWSPDSRSLAFFRFDDTRVPIFTLVSAEGIHGALEQTPYPKPGDPNPEVRIGIASLPSGKVTWADFDEKKAQYFGTPFWTPDGKELYVQWLNQGQDNFILYSLDPQTGKSKELYHEEQKSWIDWLGNIDFLQGNKGFIVASDRDGWSHLYLFGRDGKLKNRITSGKWSVASVEQVDPKGGIVYFAAQKEDSTRLDLYRIGLNGKGLKRLTFGSYTHSVSVSPNSKYFITTYSNLATPPRQALCSSDGKLLKNLGDSKGAEFDKYELARPELFRIPSGDGYDLPAVWMLPQGFDPAKKYPVIMSIYGGPGSAAVRDVWPRRVLEQWLAQEGAIQISVDHRGSGHFGKEGMALMHRCLGKWEMNDYIAAVKWLRTKPFVDASKICITGGSYGGYVTCLALTYGADYFTHGIALYSVTDYRLYDSHYTERYNDSPAENPDGYKAYSAMTHADKYKGMLRIVHGTMDDNVHMQNTIQLVDKLQDLRKHFELMIYPGGRHGWGGPKAVHLRNENYRFYYRYLLEKPFPENLFK